MQSMSILAGKLLVLKNRQKILPKRLGTDLKFNFGESNAEIKGIGHCFVWIENIKRQSLFKCIENGETGPASQQDISL